jgi:hypothetical protein
LYERTQAQQYLTAAALTFSIDGHNLKGMANVTNLVVPGIPPAPAAHAGQFLQLDVVSVARR